MSEKYKVHDPEGIYFITITVVGWVDLFIGMAADKKSRRGVNQSSLVRWFN